jgi:nicotinate-nucleotide adenylyltransferase
LVKENIESVALFGGSFDPPHLGHKTVVEEALKLLNVDKLVVVPTFLNPFKSKSYFSVNERLTLTKELFKVFETVLVDDYEINQKKPTPTVETLRHFQKKYKVLYVIIGADNLENIDKWKDFEYLNAQITWVIATRNGYEIKSDKLRDFKVLNINVNMSSTQIRNNMTKESLYMSTNEMSVEDRAERIVTFLDDKKADELEVFNLDEVDYIAKRVVIANAISSKHAAALADMLKKELKPLGEVFLHIDESDDWVVVDLGDILIHLMTTEARQTYNMEEFLAELSAGKFKAQQITD